MISYCRVLSFYVQCHCLRHLKIGDCHINTHRHTRRSVVGIELTQQLAAEGHRIFTVEQAREKAPEVGIKLSYLTKPCTGSLKPVGSFRCGAVCTLLASPGTRVSPTHEFEVAMALLEPSAIGYWSAMHHHGLTEQVPRNVFVPTTRRVPASNAGVSSRRSRNSHRRTRYQFVRVMPEHYFGTEQVWVKEARVTITDVERTLLDGLSAPRYCGDFAEYYTLSRSVSRSSTATASSVTPSDCPRTWQGAWAGSLSAKGWSNISRRCATSRPQVSANSIPSGPRRGPINRDWMLQVNLPGPPPR